MVAETPYDLLRSGAEALAEGDWARAQALFETAAELDESAEALDGLSQAAHFQGRYADAIGLNERAFAAYRRRGDPVAAAELARRTAFLHGTVHGNMAAASGWMARAERVLAEVDECAAHGWLTLDRAPFTRDSSERERLATAALAIGRRFGDADLEFDALALLGLVHVTSGRVAGGMRLLDEAMAAVSGGEVVGGSAIADIFCRLLSACEHAVDVTRAEQWMAATDRLVPAGWSDFVAPTCRCHYGGILIAIGRWAQAEHELLTALHAFDGGYRAERSSPLLRLAELRTRQGRFDETERLVQGFEWHPTARRMLAEIALARGDHVLAQDLARLCIEGEDPLDTACAPLLQLVIDVQLARSDVVGARETLHRLIDLATTSGSEHVQALSDLATGRVLAAEGDPRASSRLATALERFSALALPLEAARARLALARVLVARGGVAATAEARLALADFERLGASRDADAAAGLLRELGAGGRTRPRQQGPLTPREKEVLSLLASGLSNAQISEHLFISRRTAEHHVGSILSKLGLRSRAAAAAYAVRESPQDP